MTARHELKLLEREGDADNAVNLDEILALTCYQSSVDIVTLQSTRTSREKRASET